jgi:hypothetical protein
VEGDVCACGQRPADACSCGKASGKAKVAATTCTCQGNEGACVCTGGQCACSGCGRQDVSVDKA